MISMSGKSLINLPSRCVLDSLKGFVIVNNGIQQLPDHPKVLVRSDVSKLKADCKVALVSGGGSGHEPAHAGYIGPGMLTAVVAGEVFTSPPASDILTAIRTVGLNNPAGVMLIVKNYTGDRLNFGSAMEKARHDGIPVDMVVVNEDCALQSADKSAGRRGLCGTVLIHKIAGAMAEEGMDLASIASACKEAVKNMGTIGLSLNPCYIPGEGPSFEIDNDEMELGLGIHGESGYKRLKVLPAAETVHAMLNHMTDPNSANAFDLSRGEEVIVMINNLGGTSVLEMNIVADEVFLWLGHRGIRIARAYCGTFMTSLDMPGVSVTMMHSSPTVLAFLDYPTIATAWVQPLVLSRLPSDGGDVINEIPMSHTRSCSMEPPSELGKILHKAVRQVFESLRNSEKHLNQLDHSCGDGDTGATFKRLADVILPLLNEQSLPLLPVNRPSELALYLADMVEQDMGGTTGALYSIFLSAASVPLKENYERPEIWLQAFEAGLKAIMRYGETDVGDRTMVDALYPACCTLSSQLFSGASSLQAFAAATEAAEQGAASTAGMKARAGRASYVSEEHLSLPDPGAHAVGIWMRAAFEVFTLMTWTV